MPEGIDNNPVAYDLVLELGWRAGHVDVTQWIRGYVQYRYGRSDPDIDGAWDLLLKTAYCRDNGGPEIVLCSTPATPAKPVTTWGSLKIGYDPAVFARAVALFARASARFADSETFRLDLIALRLQAGSNEALRISGNVDLAVKARDRASFEEASDSFLRLGRETDRLLDSDPFYRLQTYKDQAIRYGVTDREQQQCLRNAMMLVTYWGGDGPRANEDNDYAYKAWAGLMRSYSLKRWEAYFGFIRNAWDKGGAALPDYYSFEHDWVDRNSSVPTP
jgi:alpha-N-acetylglucosaminidase